jgi:hypothetical protein
MVNNLNKTKMFEGNESIARDQYDSGESDDTRKYDALIEASSEITI